MSIAALELYTGEGEPPYCEMTVTCADLKTTPPDLHLVATISCGTTEHVIRLTKEAQHVITECMCQVFYHKLGYNCWKATLAFFPKDCLAVRFNSNE